MGIDQSNAKGRQLKLLSHTLVYVDFIYILFMTPFTYFEMSLNGLFFKFELFILN